MEAIAAADDEGQLRDLLAIKGKKLTRALAIMIMFVAFGIGFYHFYEEMSPLDALYFTVLTISTVGYGDLTPTSKEGKLVTCMFVFAGLALLAEAIGIVADYFLERMNEVARKVAAEAVMKEKLLALAKAEAEKVQAAEQNLETVMKTQRVGGAQSSIRSNFSSFARSDSKFGPSNSPNVSKSPSGGGKNSAMVTLISGMVAINKARGTTVVGSLGQKKSLSKRSRPDVAPEDGSPDTKKKAAGLSAEELAEEEEEQEQEEHSRNVARLWRSLFYIVLAIFAGTLFYATTEGEGSCDNLVMRNNETCIEKDWIDAFYMSCITVTSVGYGDIKPHTDGGKIFGIFWILIGTALVGRAIGNYLEFQNKVKQKEIRMRILAKPLTLAEIEMADIDDSKSLSEAEFVLYKLQAMGILTVADVDKVTRKFRMELAGDEAEIQIPNPEYVSEALGKGKDFNAAIADFQKQEKRKELVKKKEEMKEKAVHSIDKYKKGAFSGGLFKLKNMVEKHGSEELRKLMRDDNLLSSLPEADNSEEEIRHELKKLEYKMAEQRIKELKIQQTDEKSTRKNAESRKASITTMVSSFGAKMKRRASEARSTRDSGAAEGESENDSKKEQSLAASLGTESLSTSMLTARKDSALVNSIVVASANAHSAKNIDTIVPPPTVVKKEQEEKQGDVVLSNLDVDKKVVLKSEGTG
jgi:hypothetical protein